MINDKDFIQNSLELHLFFARIMKEHSFFLEAGFLEKNSDLKQNADYFRLAFEKLLSKVVNLSDGVISKNAIMANEFVTNYTTAAENKTEDLSGVTFNHELTSMEKNLQPGYNLNPELVNIISGLNDEALSLVNKIIYFKTQVLNSVKSGKVFTANYPLLIDHILREAKTYHDLILKLQKRENMSLQGILNTELFWNQIMEEHALFIRGLLDPSENDLIMKADDFANEYKNINEQITKVNMNINEITNRNLALTKQLQEFKTAGTVGLIDNKILSIIIPLLADHVLREANHYIRILNEINSYQ